MTPAYLLSKAEAAILTGQPGLAMTYMRRAGELLDERHAAHQAWKARHVFAGLGRALAGLPVAFECAARAVQDMADAFLKAAMESDLRLVKEESWL